MARYVVLLRAVNLGNYGKLAMKDLKRVLEGLRFTGVKTILASGSAVFGAKATTTAALEKRIHGALVKELGFDTDVFVRSTPEWNAIADGNPFGAFAKRDPSHLVAFVIRGKLVKSSFEALQEPGPEELAIGKGCLYITYPESIGTSKLNTNKAWKTLGVMGTARNWNTVQKIAAALAANDG